MKLIGQLLLLVFMTLSANIITAEDDLFFKQREYMVSEYLVKEGIKNERVISAMRKVQRHKFCLPTERVRAYYDQALSIGHLQTISPPWIVAYMTEVIDPQPTDVVLEIGTGSGYQAAILGELSKEVYTIEIVEPLGKNAEAVLKSLEYKNVHVNVGDGYKGWPEHAPFDKIIVTCSPEKVPIPLVEQLKEGGKMIIPLGERYQQSFYLLEKKDGVLVETKLVPTLFVPMTGKSEDQRRVKPDPVNPQVTNGGFELDANEDGLVDGWHYQRRTQRLTDNPPEGKFYLSFQNQDAGRNSHILQGLPLDGSKIEQVRISFSYRTKEAKSGSHPQEYPGLTLHLYDQKRRDLRSMSTPQFVNSAEWTEIFYDFVIPVETREAIVQVGLNGGTGRLDFDQLVIKKKLR